MVPSRACSRDMRWGKCGSPWSSVPWQIGFLSIQPFLNIPWADQHRRLVEPPKTLESDLANFQTIELEGPRSRQSPLEGRVGRFLLIKTQGPRFDFSRHADEGPSHVTDFSVQSVTSQVFDQPPVICKRLAFDPQGFGQDCAHLNQDRAGVDRLCHSSPTSLG